jgi:hypothetical protein
MNTNLRWVGALLLLGVMVGVPSCSGDEFCGDSRTCPDDNPAQAGENAGGSGATGGTDAAAGSNGDVAGGGSDVTPADGGAAGAPPSTVGNPCTTDAECDDKNSCTGTEMCVDGQCAAGTAVECPAGLVCSAAKDDACVFKGTAPWIWYTADTAGVTELYGVKSDLLGTMTPVKLSAELAAGFQVNGSVGPWSPDGSAAVFTIANAGPTKAESYLVRFGDGLPDAPVQLTKGMSASKTSAVSWSQSGKALLIARDDGPHVVDIAADGTVTQSRVGSEGYDQYVVWLKNDNEVVYYARNVITTKTSVNLAVRSGNAWTKQTLIADIGTPYLKSKSPDGGLAAYITSDAQNLQTLSTLEATEGAKPTKIAGPALVVWSYPSPDVSHYVLATTDKVSGETTVFGGAASTLSAPPTLKQHLTIGATGSLGYTFEGPWSPDSSRAAVFQNGASFGKQLVMYEPSAATAWQPVPVTQAVNDGPGLWSPDSKTFALPSRTSAVSDVALTLVESPGYVKRDFDSVTSASSFYIGPFSAGGELFVYSKSAVGYYIDLRKGLTEAPDPIAIPGAMGSRDFAGQGTDFVYVRGAENCFYMDLAAGNDPVQVNEAGTVSFCGFQKLP